MFVLCFAFCVLRACQISCNSQRATCNFDTQMHFVDVIKVYLLCDVA